MKFLETGERHIWHAFVVFLHSRTSGAVAPRRYLEYLEEEGTHKWKKRSRDDSGCLCEGGWLLLLRGVGARVWSGLFCEREGQGVWSGKGVRKIIGKIHD